MNDLNDHKDLVEKLKKQISWLTQLSIKQGIELSDELPKKAKEIAKLTEMLGVEKKQNELLIKSEDKLKKQIGWLTAKVLKQGEDAEKLPGLQKEIADLKGMLQSETKKQDEAEKLVAKLKKQLGYVTQLHISTHQSKDAEIERLVTDSEQAKTHEDSFLKSQKGIQYLA